MQHLYGYHPIETRNDTSLALIVPSRRLEDRIRELCAKVVAAREEEFGPAISDLKSALREHNQRLRKLAVSKLADILPTLRNRSI